MVIKIYKKGQQADIAGGKGCFYVLTDHDRRFGAVEHVLLVVLFFTLLGFIVFLGVVFCGLR